MAHEVDRSGYPIDPQLKRLELHLGTLAGIWRSTRNENIVKEYHAIYKLLVELGWDGSLDTDSILPKEFMPDEYFQ